MMRPLHRTILLAALGLAAGCGESAAPLPATPPPAPPDPAWFELFDGADQQFLFVNEMRRHFAERGARADLDAEGRLQVEAAGEVQHFVVAGLAAEAARVDRETWPVLIARHFETIETLRDLVGEVEVPDWDGARDRLRLRLYPDAFLTEAGLLPREVVQRVDLPGTRTVLVVDSEHTALVVPRGDLRRWGQEPDHVLALAFANTRRHLDAQIEVVEREFEGIGSLKVLTGGSFYAASAALWLGEIEGLLGAHGAIVAIPWRHGVFVYPFEDARVQTVVPALYRYAQRIVEGSAGPIGTGIWWRRPDGTFAAIEIRERDDGQLEIVPPPDLAELLRGLK
jgi:hypothetical protein